MRLNFGSSSRKENDPITVTKAANRRIKI